MLVLEAPAGILCLCNTFNTTCSKSSLKLSKSKTFRTTLPIPSEGYAYIRQKYGDKISTIKLTELKLKLTYLRSEFAFTLIKKQRRKGIQAII